MNEYTYKQICEKCVVLGECRNCDNCNGVGYTDSFVWEKEDIPDDAYDVVKEQE